MSTRTAPGAAHSPAAHSSAVQAATAVQRVAILAASGRALLRLRGGLMRDMLARRHRVLCIAPEMTPHDAAALAGLGAEVRALTVKPPLLRMLEDHAEAQALAALLGDWQPHVVLGIGAKPSSAAATAARKLANARVVLLVDGLPDGGLAADAQAARHWRKASKRADAVIFHNRDHAKAFAAGGFIAKGAEQVIVAGAGVDLSRFPVVPLPPLQPGLVFLMACGLSRARGVLDYCVAARRVKAHAASAEFLLAGPLLSGGDVTAADLAEFGDAVTYLGDLDDVRPALARAHVLVHPSRGEGSPASVLEAMATARPILTTDVAGCRDTVDERVNGCLVAPGDPAALAAAMDSFLKRPDLIPAMARASRLKAERRFDARDVNRTLLATLKLA